MIFFCNLTPLDIFKEIREKIKFCSQNSNKRQGGINSNFCGNEKNSKRIFLISFNIFNFIFISSTNDDNFFSDSYKYGKVGQRNTNGNKLQTLRYRKGKNIFYKSTILFK